MSNLIKNGYLLDTTKIPKSKIDQIKKDLTVKPVIFNDYGKKAEEFQVFREDGNNLLIPKFYAKTKIGNPDKVNVNTGQKVKITFKKELRDIQKPIAQKVLDAMETDGGGLLSLACGEGKTVLALYIAAQLGVKTLVVVHAGFLVNQWKKRIEEFTDAEVGLIQQNKVIVDGKQIVMGMIQSICKDKYDDEVFADFGLVIIDEAHLAPSEYFSRALPVIACAKTLALTATPKRKDRLEKVLHWYFGPMIYKSKKKLNNNVLANIYEFNCKDKKYFESFNYRTGLPITAKNLNRLVEIKVRNTFIVDIIAELIMEPDRKILILSERLEHINELKQKLDERNICTTGKYIGGMKEKDLNESEKKDVIFGSYQMASTGLDIPALNSLIFVTPRSEIEQSVGRILRKDKCDIQPVIIDIVDNLTAFKRQGMKRMRYYESMNYQMFYNIVEEGEIKSQEEMTQTKANFILNPEKALEECDFDD
jgi:superfamily II DNA or RNA helicase